MGAEVYIMTGMTSSSAQSRRCKRLNADTITRCSKMTTNKNRDCGSHNNGSTDPVMYDIEDALTKQAATETAYLRRRSSEIEPELVQSRLEEFDKLSILAAEEFEICATKGSAEESSMELVRAEKHVELLRYPQDRRQWQESWVRAAILRAKENKTLEIDYIVRKASRGLADSLAEIDFHYGLKYGDLRKFVANPITADDL